jgi:hypothetical protein
MSIYGLRNSWDGSFWSVEQTWDEDRGNARVLNTQTDADALCAAMMGADAELDCQVIELEECVKCGDLDDVEAGYWKHTPASWDSPADDEFYCEACGDRMAGAEDRYWDAKIAEHLGK